MHIEFTTLLETTKLFAGTTMRACCAIEDQDSSGLVSKIQPFNRKKYSSKKHISSTLLIFTVNIDFVLISILIDRVLCKTIKCCNMKINML